MVLYLVSVLIVVVNFVLYDVIVEVDLDSIVDLVVLYVVVVLFEVEVALDSIVASKVSYVVIVASLVS